MCRRRDGGKTETGERLLMVMVVVMMMVVGWVKKQNGVIDVGNEGVRRRNSARGRCLVKCVDIFQSPKCSNLP